MSRPVPYHLRLNKAVDRLALIETIKRLSASFPISDYTYCGMGGPFLEDFRILYELWPELEMTSIERNKEVAKRQWFHLPSNTVTLDPRELRAFINEFDAGDRPYIFWLDYTDLRWSDIDEFQILLGKLAERSVIKITLNIDVRNYRPPESVRSFLESFERVLPDASGTLPGTQHEFAAFIQNMLRVATQQALSGYMQHTFQPVASFYYADGACMMSLTGIVCHRDNVAWVDETFSSLSFANLDWHAPIKIDLPVLSTKERLHLQKVLPVAQGRADILAKRLGYLISESRRDSVAQLEQYALFHRYTPYFIRGVP